MSIAARYLFDHVVEVVLSLKLCQRRKGALGATKVGDSLLRQCKVVAGVDLTGLGEAKLIHIGAAITRRQVQEAITIPVQRTQRMNTQW